MKKKYVRRNCAWVVKALQKQTRKHCEWSVGSQLWGLDSLCRWEEWVHEKGAEIKRPESNSERVFCKWAVWGGAIFILLEETAVLDFDPVD
jgi:hypothetical protein